MTDEFTLVRSRSLLRASSLIVCAIAASFAIWVGFHSRDDDEQVPELGVQSSSSSEDVGRTSTNPLGRDADVNEDTERSIVEIDLDALGATGDQEGLRGVSELLLNFVPPPGKRFLGAVVSFKGIEGKRSSIEVSAGSLSARLDVEGCFPVKVADVLGLLSVEATGFAGYGRWLSASELLGANEVEIEVVLEDALSIPALVLDRVGSPASGAVIKAVMLSGSETPGIVRDRRFEADREGQVQLTGLSPGDWSIQAVAWKDWESSERISLALSPNLNDQNECLLIVERWDLKSYSSGRLVRSAGSADGVAHLEACDFPGRSYPVYGDEFFVRVPNGEPISVRAVSSSGNRVGECFDLRAGVHRLEIIVD